VPAAICILGSRSENLRADIGLIDIDADAPIRQLARPITARVGHAPGMSPSGSEVS
jgi:hypothetical protein